MNPIKETSPEQISYTIQESSKEIPIFDNDYWLDEQKQISTEKSLKDNDLNVEQTLLSKIDNQIMRSKQKFFNASDIKQFRAIQSKENILSKLANPHCILKEGFLKKKTDGIFFTWRTRYIVLTPQKIISFEDEKKDKPIGCVNLKLLHTDISESNEGLVLDFNGQCQNLILKGQNKQQQKEWRQVIKQTLQYHSKQVKLFLKTINKPLYQNQDILSQKQFISTAQTGDILLFYTNNIGAKLQRFFTNSDFDHVAMIVKMRHKELMVFESNQMHGVSVYNWKQYISYFDLYNKVTLRKLSYVRKTQAQNNLLTFMKKNIGKKYELSAYKLLKLQSDFDWNSVNEQRGYFCSEVVAKALKCIGLLDEKKSCGRYWPVDFSEKANLKLKKGASFGAQQTIILNKHTKNQL